MIKENKYFKWDADEVREATICRLGDLAFFVKAPSIGTTECMVHISRIPETYEPIIIREQFKIGQKVKVKILEIEDYNRIRCALVE